ncbi:hypothetical protein XELAEV_18010936mg [Xenopus laevis]|uniref:Uncharacterized protein n=1 Tax=Xenopus laevis TaxID=8355 RepID=A0A974I277_XENLA|nr:hypothetical protein XELAEV_18010936mg [Xenopus laevis]
MNKHSYTNADIYTGVCQLWSEPWKCATLLLVVVGYYAFTKKIFLKETVAIRTGISLYYPRLPRTLPFPLQPLIVF